MGVVRNIRLFRGAHGAQGPRDLGGRGANNPHLKKKKEHNDHDVLPPTNSASLEIKSSGTAARESHGTCALPVLHMRRPMCRKLAFQAFCCFRLGCLKSALGGLITLHPPALPRPQRPPCGCSRQGWCSGELGAPFVLPPSPAPLALASKPRTPGSGSGCDWHEGHSTLTCLPQRLLAPVSPTLRRRTR